ncbi:hypothetical protein T484DRAFT_1794805 [Baffinella frigidus]|nr:hypothetical protein T484DRAFT_1794805 [Cryptophyta sp. CCMP2293]
MYLNSTSDGVYLNSISGGWTYELGGPDKEAEQVYFLKRISKGWVFRQYPGPWQALVERPDGSVQVLATYDQRPLLRETYDSRPLLRELLDLDPRALVSGLVRKYSFDKFAINNDRYAKGFGARL